MARVGWIGLGVMGFPMAGHIAQKGGHDLVVYNRTRQKAEDWVKKYGTGRVAETPADAAQDADFVFSCVGNDDDVRQVTLAAGGAFEGMKKNAVFIDNTTASADVARQLYGAAKDMGFHFLDAPVSGGQAGAENGILTVMIGGDQRSFESAKPIIACYAKMANLIGPSGAGQLAKMVNQICIAGLVQGLAEGLHLAQKNDLDIATVMATIAGGAAQSWQMENRWQTMTDGKFDYGFAVDWMLKDLGICLDQARRCGASLPVTALVDQFYSDIQRMGGGRWDTSSLITRLNRK